MASKPVAFSYVRFSQRKQEAGDSIRRQETGAKAWAERNGVRLDTSLKIDKGISAFKGKNADLGSLGEFLKQVEADRVPKGSYLVVEALDRLTRDDVQPALRLILGLIGAGVRVVQLTPVEVVYDDKSNSMSLMMMIMELSRGNSESKVKSERVGRAWGEKKERARKGVAQKATATMGDNSRVLTRRLPAWVRARGGKLVLIPERAEVVRRIFDLAAAGYGVPSICRKLTEEGVKPFGRTARWVGGYVGLILKDRRALGEYLPHRVPTEQEVERYEKAGKPVPRRVPDGDPVPGYFPAVVDADLYHAARAGARERLTNPGRLGTTSVNVFAGRLYHARTKDETYFQTQRQFKDGDGVKRVTQILINTSATNGARAYSIPYEPFEAAVLSLLREVDPAELLPTTAPPDETLVLTEELAELDARIACLEAELTQGDVAALARVLRQLEAQRADVAARLDQARERAATPVGAAWAEAQSLAAALANAPDQQDARLRLRSALRRVVTDLRLLVVPKGLDRVCAVQARFADTEEARDWLFVYTPGLKTRAGGVRQASWGAWSVRRAAGPFLDLRDPKDSKRLEDVLSLPVPAVPPRPPVTEDDEARIAAEVAAVPHAPQSPEEVRAALRAAFAGSTSPLMRQLAAAADVKDKAALAWLWAMVTAAKAQG